ncbi:MAG: PIG-L family deacetylase [Desulfomonile tiedjei]|nr:PIG-L family deacetylase [Desulfomonile tiedjei]
MRMLVIAPHPDDEVFGAGGTMAKYADAGNEVHVLIITKGDELFDPKLIERGREEAVRAHALLGVKKTHFADLPSIKLDTLPQYEINDRISTFLRQIEPELLFLPFPGDINRDHQIVHSSAMVAARPLQTTVRCIYCYEVLSSTNWNSPAMTAAFVPNVFCDVSTTIDRKIAAANLYESQIKAYPHERSPESIMVLSRYRGGFVGMEHAEAFVCVRHILP